ncbi:MAG: replicative DNA helicase, partial [Candidatus Pacebacteria bacterium]|nr:replicative DNA helicase [Candidatus Paceibacterota bacterium]
MQTITNDYATKSGLRVPPQNIDSEKALLGSIMLRSEVLFDILELISEECFYSEKHRLVYKTIMDLFSQKEPIDLLTLSTKLKEHNQLDQIGGNDFLNELVNVVPSSANAKHYAKIVHKKYMMRRLIGVSEQISELGYAEKDSLENALDKAEKSIFEVTGSLMSSSYIKIKDALGEAWERLNKLHETKGELRGVPTGFKELDNKLAGFQNSDLIILAARPSMGKTSLALDIARKVAVKDQKAVAIFSLEMSSQQLVDRMLAADSQVDAWKLRTGKLSTDEEFKLIRESL